MRKPFSFPPFTSFRVLVTTILILQLEIFCVGSSYAAPRIQFNVLELDVSGTGESEIVPFGISNGGYIVGTGTLPTGSLPYIWHSGKWEQLPLPAGSASAVAYAVNARGWVVGSSNVTGISRPTIWKSGDIADISTSDPELFKKGGVARSINDSGVVVGTAYLDGGHAFVYSSLENSAKAIPGDGLTLMQNATSINNNNWIAGSGVSANWGSAEIALAWDNSKQYDLGRPADFAIRREAALAMNDFGGVVGYSVGTNGFLSGTFWSGTDIRQVFNAVGYDSAALDINASGVIVGYIGGAGGSIYFENQAYLLNSLIHPNDNLFGRIDIRTAYGINDWNWIAGNAYIDGTLRSVLLVPVPEPESLAFLVVGIGILSVFRASSHTRVT